jgi:hypothetical protein
MEVPQGSSLCSYFKQEKMSFIFPFFSKLENFRVEQVLPGRVEADGMGEQLGKRYKMLNMVQILCTQECKLKKDTF